MTLEEDLRLTLHEQADKPVMRPDLLDRVRLGVRRDNRNRTAMMGAAVLLAAVATVPVVLAQRPQSPVQNATPPVPSPSSSHAPSDPAPSPSSPQPSTVVWEKARLNLPTFPLTPGWLPAGLGPRRIDQLGPNVLLRYEDGRGDVLSLEVGPVAGDWEVEGDEDHRSTVGTASATVRTGAYDGARAGDRYVGIRWKLADGQWAQLLSFGPRTESEVLRFARGLRRQTLPASPAPFRLAEVPRGLTLTFVSAHYLCLGPQPVTRETMQQGLCVGVESAQSAEVPLGSALTIAGRPAIFAGDSLLQIDLGNQQVLTVRSDPATVSLTDEELVRFATGVQVSGS